MASPDYHVGAHFEALGEGVLMAPSKSIGYFLQFQVALKYGAGDRCGTGFGCFKGPNGKNKTTSLI